MSRRIISQLGRRIAAVGVAGVALSFGACADAATAPAARDIAAPNSALVGSGGIPQVVTFASVRVTDIYGNRIANDPLLAVTFTTLPSGDSVVIEDNKTGDLDSIEGVVRAAIKPGTSYKVCFQDAYFYMNDDRDALQYPKCRTVTTASLTVDMGKIFGRRFPRIQWQSRDTFGNLIVPGGSVQVTMFGWTQVIADHDKNFGGVEDGIVKFETRSPPTKVKWCEYAAPPKYLLISAKCGEIQTQFEQTHVVKWVHEKLIF